MNIINHPVKVNRVRIINQILDIVCLLANFHPNSLDFIRQLQRWIGCIDLMEMTGQVSIGKEYWSVIGPKHVTTGIWDPALVQGWLFHSLPNGFSSSSLEPPFSPDLGSMTWCFRVFKDCRVCLVLRGAGVWVWKWHAGLTSIEWYFTWVIAQIVFEPILLVC